MTATEVRPSPAVRSARDVGWLLGGLAVLAVTTVLALPDPPAGWEVRGFRALNDHDVVPFALVWLVMQAGNVGAAVVVALLAGAFRRWWLAAAVALGGGLAYLLAKVVKELVDRGRPATLLGDVQLRGAEALGLGFVSGHAAVVTALVVVAAGHVARRAAWALAVLAALVGLARIYVGAHLPLDVVGGVALGLAVGAAVRLLLGRPPGHRPARSRDEGDDA